jgi:SEC-C motif-containing protein
VGKNDPCPCSSGKPYAACCAPLHDRAREPEQGEELVRSRYAAFALGKVDYLLRTLHEDHPDRSKPQERIEQALKAASSAFKYMGLSIIESEPRDKDGYCRVLYLARIFRRGEDVSFLELAEFLHDGVGLRYRNGKTKEAAGMKSPPAGLSIATFAAD